MIDKDMNLSRQVICEIEQLNKYCFDKSTYIWGTGVFSKKIGLFLQNQGIKVLGYIVGKISGEFHHIDNLPICELKFLENKKLECVVVPVGVKHWDKIEGELEKYSVKMALFIHPRLKKQCFDLKKVSKLSLLSPRLVNGKRNCIYADDESVITIDDNVIIGDDVEITVRNGSKLWLKRGAVIGNNVLIDVSDYTSVTVGEFAELKGCEVVSTSRSRLVIGGDTTISEGTKINVCLNSVLEIGKGNNWGERLRILVLKNSRINISDRVAGLYDCRLAAYRGASIDIGKMTTIGNDVLMIGDNNTCIECGVDCMFSSYIRVAAGNHKIMKINTNENITKYENVKIGKHVWVGMGTSLLAGSQVMDECICGANSVINSLVDENCICAGNPARIIRNGIHWERDSAFDSN